MKEGDLVKHVSDAECNRFGVGIVTNIISMGADGKRGLVRVHWQFPPTDIVYPADIFTPEGLIVLSEAPSADEHIITNENQTR